jgi:hypothetical protein
MLSDASDKEMSESGAATPMRRHDDQVHTPFCLCANYNLRRQTDLAQNFVSDRVRNSFLPDLLEFHLRLLFPDGKRRGNRSHIAGGKGCNRKWNYMHQVKGRIILRCDLTCDVERGHGIVVEVYGAENPVK